MLVVDVWMGEQGGFSSQIRAGLACPTPYVCTITSYVVFQGNTKQYSLQEPTQKI